MSTHLDECGRPVMVDVGGKSVTQREAEAEGFVLLAPAIAEAIKNGTVPKGDVFRVAELAGITATKRTPELIPLCHAIRLDHAKVVCELDELRVRVTCTVKSSEVTGVEMEALTGVSVACLTIYDMCKGIDKGMSVEGVRLLRKSGGKSGDYRYDTPPVPHVHEENKRVILAGVLTVSDKGSRGERIDTAGPQLAAMLKKFGAQVECTDIVPDDKEQIASKLAEWADAGSKGKNGTNGKSGKKLELILTTGGTGLSPRDVTPEALLLVGDRVVPGIGECMRVRSLAQTPN